MNIYKLLAAVVLAVAIIVFGPLLAQEWGMMQAVEGKAWLVLTVTAVTMIIKLILGDMMSKEFFFYKFGYDNCIMTLGAVLTALSLQLLATTDLFPGMSNVGFFRSLPELSSDAVANRSAQLLILLVFALASTLLTARIAAAIKHENVRAPDFLAILNALIGLAMLGSYVLILITKG